MTRYLVGCECGRARWWIATADFASERKAKWLVAGLAIAGRDDRVMDAGLNESLKFIKRLQFVCLTELVC